MANHKLKNALTLPVVLRRLLLSWLISVAISYLVLPAEFQRLETLDGLAQMSLLSVLIMTCIFFITLTIIGTYWNKPQAERWLLLCIYALLCSVCLCRSFTWPFLISCCIIFLILLFYVLKGWQQSSQEILQPRKAPKAYKILLAILSAAFVLFVSIWTVCRVYSFCTPTYDFGIFSQMFYSMKTTGLPYTTVERDGLLSHFYVHVSPVYYLLLPVYFLFPKPATLQIMQAIILASSVIPLWKLSQSHGLHPLVSLCVCALLLVYPAFSGGTSYDIHENAFLTPFILWLFYGIDRKNTAITIIFACMTLLVKEDAAVYVTVISLYLLLKTCLQKRTAHRAWGLLTGSIMLAGSLLWFLLVTRFLSEVGDGVMTYRYQNLMYDGSSSLLSVIKSVILCPMKALYEAVDSEKIKFLFLTMLPLLGLPLFTRKYERYILIIPYILINLISDYQYQHDIYFQYTFGSTACLFYLTVINLSDLKDSWKQGLISLVCLAIGCTLFADTIIPTAIRYPKYCIENKEYYQQIHQALSLIPEDASVSASTFYTTELSQREVLYDVKYASVDHLLSTQYIALAVSNATSYTRYAVDGENGYENLVTLLEINGYEIFASLDDDLVIYYKPA